jgi:hypothetical protein
MNSLSRDVRRKWRLNSYSFSACICVEKARQWALREGMKPQFELVFEAGDFGQGELLNVLPCAIVRPKKDVIDKKGVFHAGFTGLQAADFLAHEMFVACRKGKYPTYDPNWPMEQFNKMQSESVEIYETRSLNELLRFA